tara:strand:- start:3 stop:761 length:759 start_codon:yes stop_codon:yes gene_type:complete
MKGFSGPFKKTYEGEVKSIPREVTPIAREVQRTPNVNPSYRQEVKSIRHNVTPIARKVNPPQRIIPSNRQYIEPIRHNMEVMRKVDTSTWVKPPGTIGVAYRSSDFKNPTTQQKLNKKRKLDYKPQSSFKQGILDAPMKQKKKERKPIERLPKVPYHEKTHEFPPKQKTSKLSPPSHEFLHSAFPQVNEAGTEDASPGGGTPPPSKPTIKSVQKRIADLKLHKQTNTKEYKNLVAMLNKGYKNQSNNYDEID